MSERTKFLERFGLITGNHVVGYRLSKAIAKEVTFDHNGCDYFIGLEFDNLGSGDINNLLMSLKDTLSRAKPLDDSSERYMCIINQDSYTIRDDNGIIFHMAGRCYRK